VSKQKTALGDGLRTLREMTGVSPETLGAMIGISGNSVRNYEKGREPGALARVAIAAFIEGLRGGADDSPK
jgi:DNA-binding transcriptional regulator YiaG